MRKVHVDKTTKELFDEDDFGVKCPYGGNCISNCAWFDIGSYGLPIEGKVNTIKVVDAAYCKKHVIGELVKC